MKTFAIFIALVTSAFCAYTPAAQTTQSAAVATLTGTTMSGAPWDQPIDPDVTPGTRRLLAEMDALSGQATLMGQHNYLYDVSRWSDRVLDLTGEFPALFGQDFGFSGGEDKDSTLGRPTMLAEVERQYKRGAVIALCWHAVRPTDDEPVTFHDSVQGHLTDAQWTELLTPGSPLNLRWQAQTDVTAAGLQQLQQRGVAVLFRPFHEMIGNWFWWGGRPGPQGSAQLYRMLYDSFVRVHGLHNLVWVWNVNAPSAVADSIADYDPGQRYADLYTIDVYGKFEQSYFDTMPFLAKNKPVALAEVGTMPTLDTLAQQPRWAHFMMWSSVAEHSNSPALLQANFHAARLLSLSSPLLAPRQPPPAAQRLDSKEQAR